MTIKIDKDDILRLLQSKMVANNLMLLNTVPVNVSSPDPNVMTYITRELIRFFYSIEDVKYIKSIKLLNGNELTIGVHGLHKVSNIECIKSGILISLFIDDITSDLIVEYETTQSIRDNKINEII